MSWTCPCGANNRDELRSCGACRRPLLYNPPPSQYQQPPPPGWNPPPPNVGGNYPPHQSFVNALHSLGAAETAKLSFGAGFGATAGIAAGRTVGKFFGCAAILVVIAAVLLFLGSITSVFKSLKSAFAPSPPAIAPKVAPIPTRDRRFSDLQRRRAEAEEEAQIFGHENNSQVVVPPSAPPTTQGGVYRVGGGVSAPTVLYKVDPPYTEEARLAKLSGSVLVSLVVGADGRARNIKIIRGLGLGLDEKAVEAVAQWRFRPGIKDGYAVSTQATIEVNFRLL